MENREGYKKTELGWIPEEWSVKQLNEIAKINSSSLPNNTASDYEFYYIDIASIIRPGVIAPISKMTYAQAPIRARRIVEYGDIIISTVRPYLKAFALIPLTKDNVICSTGFAVIRVNKDISNTFVFQYVLSELFLNQVQLLLVGSNYPAINSSDVKNIEIPLPPLPEQQKIASTLTTVDDKISSIEAQIQQTEQLKKGLMAKLLTEGIGHTEFKDTEIGRIPKGWEVVELGKISYVIRGASPRPKGDIRYYGGDIPRLMGQDVTRDGKIVFPKIDFLTEEGAKKSRLLPKGSLVLTCSGTVGIPTILGIDACIHDGFIAFNNISADYDIEFLYYIFASLESRFNNSATHGGVFTNLTTGSIKEFIIAAPPLPEQQQIASILSSVDDKIDILQSKKSAYTTLKKGLMAKLLTGQMRVKI